jgi:hypothetical protein
LLYDGTITDEFLELFGRPPRDTGYESERNNKISVEQLRYLLNSSTLFRKIQSSPYIRKIIVDSNWNKRKTIENIYLSLLSRYPADYEIEILENYFNKKGLNFNQAVEDIVWAIINSKEFLYKH